HRRVHPHGQLRQVERVPPLRERRGRRVGHQGVVVHLDGLDVTRPQHLHPGEREPVAVGELHVSASLSTTVPPGGTGTRAWCSTPSSRSRQGVRTGTSTAVRRWLSTNVTGPRRATSTPVGTAETGWRGATPRRSAR